MTQKKKTTNRSRRRRKKKQPSFLRRLLSRKSSMLLLWLGGIAACTVYVFVFYNLIAPFTLRWKALYGDATIPEGYSIQGIDVSHHQGVIDWERVAQASIKDTPVSFVFVKATEGKSLIDENFNDNFYEAREAGFLRGAYHFFVPGVPAKAQAEFYLKQVHLEDGDLPPVLDIERVGELTPAEIRKAALVWLEIVEKKYGVRPIIYTYVKFKQQYLNTPEFDKYPFWIAHYYVPSLKYKGAWKFWQHTDRGKLDGIEGFVDFNIYNGSMYDLRQMTLEAGR